MLTYSHSKENSLNDPPITIVIAIVGINLTVFRHIFVVLRISRNSLKYQIGTLNGENMKRCILNDRIKVNNVFDSPH